MSKEFRDLYLRVMFDHPNPITGPNPRVNVTVIAIDAKGKPRDPDEFLHSFSETTGDPDRYYANLFVHAYCSQDGARFMRVTDPMYDQNRVSSRNMGNAAWFERCAKTLRRLDEAYIDLAESGAFNASLASQIELFRAAIDAKGYIDLFAAPGNGHKLVSPAVMKGRCDQFESDYQPTTA